MSQHKWDKDGERCIKCGAKDWMDTECEGTVMSGKGEEMKKYSLERLQAAEEEIADLRDEIHQGCHKQLMEQHKMFQGVLKNIQVLYDNDVERLTKRLDKTLKKNEQQSEEITRLREALTHLDQQWIPVSERLPEQGQKVIAHYSGVYDYRLVTFWKDKQGHFGGLKEADGLGSQPATHWMPLPEPPCS